jgi:hypothetical protein
VATWPWISSLPRRRFNHSKMLGNRPCRTDTRSVIVQW